MEPSWSRSKFFLDHASVLIIERYLGCKQKEPVNDRFGYLL
jgi:hypothetical protein